MLQVLDPGARERRLVPLRLEACELPLRLSYLGYVDFTDPVERAFAWERLLGALGAEVDDAAVPPPGSSGAPAVQGVPDIDPDDPPMAAVRRLLTEAFTAAELRRFCQDRPVLRPVVASFGPGQGLADMADRLIDFVRVRLLWSELLAAVAAERPRQYERFLDWV
jgi:hypothetical protein